MVTPDYQNNSIVNAAASILQALDVKPLYNPLSKMEFLSEAKTIVLLVIDGLGYQYLKKYAPSSFFGRNIKQKLTSVFPSTTASALTTLETGVAPQQHSITGWFTYLKELGVVAKILPFYPRCGGSTFAETKIEREAIFTEARISDKTNRTSAVVYPEDIIDGKVNKKDKTMFAYTSFDDMLQIVSKRIRNEKTQHFIYAYWSEFDSICHKHGIKSSEAFNHFTFLDKKLETFSASLKGSDTALIITADHGLIDTNQEKVMVIDYFPQLQNTLTLPLCGESRVSYAYIKPSKYKLFENIIATKFNDVCWLYRSEDLIEQNWFGLFQPNPKLYDRVGDYVLLMKDNYIMKDFLLGEERKFNTGNHGGVSSLEMFVPLIFFEL